MTTPAGVGTTELLVSFDGPTLRDAATEAAIATYTPDNGWLDGDR